MLVAKSIAFAERHPMPPKKHVRPGEGVPAVTKSQEGKALHALWKRRKKRTQAEFAAECNLSTGYLPQFFSGMRPITLELATRFADELGVDISDFSPRLAQELNSSLEASEWPFKGFTRADYAKLTPGQRHALENLIAGFLHDHGVVSARKLRRVV